MIDKTPQEGYFWDNNTDDLAKNIYGRYRKGDLHSGYTVATIKRQPYGDEEIFMVKLLVEPVPWVFDNVTAAQLFIEAWFRPTKKELR